MTGDVKRMYINGEWSLAEGGATFDIVNPADQSVVATVTNGAAPEIQRAVAAAHAAFREWSLLAPKDRGRFLLGIQELMQERCDELARLVTLENGKPFEEARKEVQFSLGYFGWFAEEARRMTGEGIPAPQPGKGIMETAARQIKRLSFELGGNAPFIVFDDADLEPAVDGAVAMKFLRVGGQSCICANRIYVQRGIAERFIPAFIDAVKRLKVAPGFEPGAQVGPLINEETRAKVHALVEDAVKRGARLVCGGHYLTEGAHAKGFFYAPAVLLDVTDDMAIAQEEIFEQHGRGVEEAL